MMTYRDLLRKLNSLSDEELDQVIFLYDRVRGVVLSNYVDIEKDEENNNVLMKF
jgi:hypothetical protein